MTRVVPKPWGQEEIFAETAFYVGKILTVRAGHALSLQYHERKTETMRVLAGHGELHLGHRLNQEGLESFPLSPGSVIHLPPLTVHRIVAHTDLTLVEVSTPHLDDVVRLEDRYGRAGSKDP
ncbi:MAG: cupin domain-containing protein [Thermoanaerobaculum sp.]|nr:cupin domain-containing protein [Thermoanaerobaculum sp.]MDW7966965.1 cupin domain-containing protein [Thermoanaerobaculum sp.]